MIESYSYNSRMGEEFCKNYMASTLVSKYLPKSSRDNPKLIWKLSNIRWKIMNVQLNEFKGDPYRLQFNQNMTTDCCYLPFFTHSYLILPVANLKLFWNSKQIWFRNRQKLVKIPKPTNKWSSSFGLIEENTGWKTWSFLVIIKQYKSDIHYSMSFRSRSSRLIFGQKKSYSHIEPAIKCDVLQCKFACLRDI
jgi:hypothetical protein